MEDREITGGNHIVIKLRLKGEEKEFKRKVYTLMDLIGDVGGFNDGLLILVGLIVNFYGSSMFERAIAQSIF